MFRRGCRRGRSAAGLLALALVPALAAGSEGTDPALGDSSFASFLTRAAASPQPLLLVDALLASRATLPIVEGQHLVHFVWRGRARRVALRGSMTDSEPGDPGHPLRRLPGTDFFYRSYRVEPDTRWDYRFEIDEQRLALDPGNPLTAPGRHGRGRVSELRMPESRPAPDLEPPTGMLRGRLEELLLESEVLGELRRARVYLPPGYAPVGDRYPLLVVADGLVALQAGHIANTLDNLIHHTLTPLVAVFVEARSATELSGRRAPDYARMLAEELLPLVESRYHAGGAPATRALHGADHAAVAALHTAAGFPGAFGRLALQSVPLRPPWGEVLLERLSDPSLPALDLYLDWGRWEFRSARLGFDRGEDARRLVALLRERGQGYHGGELPEGSGWGSWRDRNHRILEAFFPRRIGGR